PLQQCSLFLPHVTSFFDAHTRIRKTVACGNMRAARAWKKELSLPDCCQEFTCSEKLLPDKVNLKA
ncbi:MAG: hypothetical protein K2N94_14140, partial [Lachnospiraceae bacterium]|nr:hypothetical protein [Lachnospiraceae bacterium]